MADTFGLSADDLAVFTDAELAAFSARDKWLKEARPNQKPPPGDWDTLLWLAGRFYGKSRCLTEVAWWEMFKAPGIRIHALAPTIGDIRRTVLEGESGFMNKCPPELINEYNRSLHEVTFHNGSKLFGYSTTEESDRLRGPQCSALFFDEAAAADRPAGNLEMAYKVAVLGCRLPHPDGKTPARKYIATTPRPIPFLKKLIARPNTVVIRGTSYENIKNVASSISNELLAIEGTSFARQELHGEILDNAENAIFQRSWFRLWPNGKKLPEFSFILVSIDPAVSERDYDKKTQTRDPSGCAVLGVFNTKQCFTEKELQRMGVRSKYAAVLCDYWTDYLGFPDLIERIRKVTRTKYGAPGRYPDITLIEAEKTGISIRQVLFKYGVATWPSNPHGQSKTMRAHAVSPLILQGMFFVPESSQPGRQGEFRDWAEPLVDQMCSFAGEGSTQHDEAIDTCCQAMAYLSEKGFFQAAPLEKAYPDIDEKEDAEQRRAVAEYEREKRGRVSAYGE